LPAKIFFRFFFWGGGANAPSLAPVFYACELLYSLNMVRPPEAVFSGFREVINHFVRVLTSR